MNRLCGLFLSLVVALPSVGRVISYAPYSNRPAMTAYHERTSRYFALLEGIDESWFGANNEVVLYDSAGLEEPRVIYPQNGDDFIEYAALYEPHSPLGEAPPMLIIGAYDRMLFTRDGGQNWLTVGGLGSYWVGDPSKPDTGGPFTRGLGAPIQIGNDEFPFVVSLWDGIYAISREGTAKLLAAGYGVALGRNAAGDRFLARVGSEIEILDLDGHATPIGTDPTAYPLAGWITSEGSAYLLLERPEGESLALAHDGEIELVLGPYSASPPPPPLGAPIPQYSSVLRFLAIPTNDYNGAWMVQRDPGKPTTLYRHTPAGGTETMWSDISGPQIEALIAGESGQSLLIQVHRERDVAVEVPFFDPALAVWHVGDAMPRAYDELYLNERWNKGFVHVDVDSIETGQPFVFNSGFEMLPDVILSPAPPGGGGDVIQEWGIVRASLRQRLVLPGVARLEGAFNSHWLTDVMIFNPLDVPQEVEIRFVSLGSEVAQSRGSSSVTLTLGPQEIRNVPDALHALFGIESGGGALYFLPQSGMNVTGRTYSRNGDGGTFGFGMQAIDFYNAAGPRFPVTFAGAFPGEHFRTNVLLTDTSGRGTAAELKAFGVSGAIGATDFSLSAPMNGILQFNGLDAQLGLTSGDAGGLIAQPTRGTAIPTVVAIDNRTNDPTYFPPDISADIPRVIPVIGHLDGAFGSRFRSDLYLFNPSRWTQTVILEAKSWDSPARKLIQFTLLPLEARVVRDALQVLFGMSGSALLRFSSSPVDGVRVTSRTYTVEESGATYGCLIPPLNNFQIAGPGDRLEILGVTGGDGFRVNIGLVELSNDDAGVPASVRVSILDGAANVLDHFTITVPQRGGMQLNDIFAARGITPPPAARITIDMLEGHIIGAYATLTDNITNDSTFLAAQLGARQD